MSGTSNITAIFGTAILALTVAACADLPEAPTVTFEPAASDPFERRDVLPSVRTPAEVEFIARDHIVLGTATAERVIERCWDKSSECEIEPRSEDTTRVLLSEAMNRGADVVILTSDRKISIVPVERQGPCVNYSRKCGAKWAHTCDRSQPMVNRHLRCNNNCRDVCTAYEKITGSLQIETSSGTLWRSVSSPGVPLTSELLD